MAQWTQDLQSEVTRVGSWTKHEYKQSPYAYMTTRIPRAVSWICDRVGSLPPQKCHLEGHGAQFCSLQLWSLGSPVLRWHPTYRVVLGAMLWSLSTVERSTFVMPTSVEILTLSYSKTQKTVIKSTGGHERSYCVHPKSVYACVMESRISCIGR